MSIDIRLPNITAQDTAGKTAQMQSYLYQLAEQLNWALSAVTAAEGGNFSNVQMGSAAAAPATVSQQDAIAMFEAIKGLIIKSGDIIEAYENTMTETYSKIFVVNDEEYGEYMSGIVNDVKKNASGIEQNYNKIEVLTGQMDAVKKTNAWIRTGELEPDVFGVEVGQISDFGGVETFNKFARFTADGIYFYLPSSTDPIAYMTGQRLVITSAYIASLHLGGYYLDTTNGIAFRWVGR